MKKEKQIAAMLMGLFIGFSTINAQSSIRNDYKDKRERTTVTRAGTQKSNTHRTNNAQRINNGQQDRNVKQTVRHTTTRQVQNQRTNPNRNSVTRNHQTATRRITHNKRPVSISTPNNHRSDYHAPEARTHVKRNKYSTKRYYGGNHYHHVYPNRRIKTNYHHNTHVHGYHVLYYPTYNNIYWTRNMYRDYRRWYPNYNWRYNYGYRIHTLSVFDAKYNLGEVAMVYGRVYATWHNRETDDYLLFFGGNYPAQQFTVVLPGHIARKFSWRPERFFLGEHMTINGLITTFDGIPEIIVKNKRQVGVY